MTVLIYNIHALILLPAVCLGALTIGMAFLASMMGGLVQAGYTVVGVMSGPVLGVYMLGMAVPFCNKKGAFFGILSGWVSIFSPY